MSLNSEHTYYTAGLKAGAARRHDDGPLSAHWHRWCRKATAAEPNADAKAAAARAFERGYIDGFIGGTPEAT